MEREWLITLLYYRSLGTTKNELQFYKVGDHYEMAHVTKTLSASIDENKQNNELDLRANEKYETNTALVNSVFSFIDYWSDRDLLDEIENPPKYGDFWRKEFKRRNRKYPTGELIKKIIDTTNIDSPTEYLDGDVFL